MRGDGTVRRMVLLSSDSDLAGLELTDALGCLEDGGTSWLTADDAHGARDSIGQRTGYLGDAHRRTVPVYSQLRLSTLYGRRQYSRDLAGDKSLRRWAEKRVTRRSERALITRSPVLAPLRSHMRTRLMKSVPLHEDVLRAIERARPDVTILPFSQPDDLITDAIRCCEALNVPTLMAYVQHAPWHGEVLDPRPLEQAVALPPARVAVWGEASRDSLSGTLGFENERIALLGAPSFDSLFEDLANIGSEDVIGFIHDGEEQMNDPSLVSSIRAVADELVPEVDVVELEPDAGRTERLNLIARSRVVVSRSPECIIESAIANRPHVLLAFSGGEGSYRRLQGIDLLQGVEVCNLDGIGQALARLLRWREAPPNSLRDDVRYWVYRDQRSYGERLVALADELAAESYPRPAAVNA